jgi:hypothetical protein
VFTPSYVQEKPIGHAICPQLERGLTPRRGDAESHSSGFRERSRAVWTECAPNEKGSNMNRTDSSHRVMPRLEMMMPRLTHDQMLAILRESGVPDSEARRWVEREARLALDASAAAE